MAKPQTGSKSEPRYARLPLSVLRDVELLPVARLVYCELALWVFQGATCSLGQRAIAERLGIARNTVADALRQLEERGHVELNRSKTHGRRQMYILTSLVFGSKQGRVTEVVSAPGGGRRFASVSVEDVA